MKKKILAVALAVVTAGSVPAQAGTSAYKGSILAENATVKFKIVKKNGSKKIKGIVIDGVEAQCEGEDEPVPLTLAPGGSYKVKKNKFKVQATEPFVFTIWFEGALKKGGKALGTTKFVGDVSFGADDTRYCEVTERLWSAKS